MSSKAMRWRAIIKNFEQMEIYKPSAVVPHVAADTTSAKKYSPAIRLWHWLNALIISGSLLTVLVNSTILKPWNNASLIAYKLKDKGVNISEDQARPAAFALADRVWAIHTYF